MKYNSDRKIVINGKSGVTFVPIPLPTEIEQMSQSRRVYLSSQKVSRNNSIETRRNYIPWPTERGPLKLNALADSRATVINALNVPSEWELKLANTSIQKRNKVVKHLATKSLASAKSISTTKTSFEFPPLLSQDTKKLMHTPSYKELDKPLKITRGTKIDLVPKLRVAKRSSVEAQSLGLSNKRIKWYNKRPRVIVNKYYEYNFVGSTEKSIKKLTPIQGFINRISGLIQNQGKLTAIQNIEHSKVKISPSTN